MEWKGRDYIGLGHQGTGILGEICLPTKKPNFDYKCVPGDLWLKGTNTFQLSLSTEMSLRIGHDQIISSQFIMLGWETNGQT